jgi:hypothetical protein
MQVTPVPRRLAFYLLSVVFLVSVYRAWTQSITIDEAFMYNRFLAGSFSRLFGDYDASNHVLYAILAKLSIACFGLTEFTLRLPSLLGGALYLLAVYRLSRRLLGEGPLFLISVALLSLNPHMLDFMSAARGYGLGLALFLWSLYQALLYVDSKSGPPGRSRLYQAGVGLALSVAANLTLLPPAAGLAIILTALLLFDKDLGGAAAVKDRFWLAVHGFAFPGVVVAFVLLVLPLSSARLDDFYIGEPALEKSLESLAMITLFHHPLPARVAGALPSVDFWFRVLKVLAPFALAVAAAACFAALVRWRQRGDRPLGATWWFLLLGGGSLLVSLIFLVVLHHVAGRLYPYMRTGLYLVPLFLMTTMALWSLTRRHRVAAIVTGLPLGALAALCLTHFLANFQWTHYGEWRFDQSTKKIVQLIRAREGPSPRGKVRVGITWLLEPSVNFYRKRYRLDWMREATREGAGGDFDYYLLLPEDAPLVAKLGLSVIHSDDASGAILAVRQPLQR